MRIHDRQRRPRQVDSLFNLEQLIRLATTSGQGNTKSQKSQRKRKKGEGGCIVISQAAIGVCWCAFLQLVDGWTPVSPAQLLSSLLLWTVLHRCSSVQKCCPLSQSSRTAPSSPTGQHTHTRKVFPPGRHSLRGQEARANQRSPHIRASPVIGRGWEEKVEGKFHASDSWILLHGVRCLQTGGSERETSRAQSISHARHGCEYERGNHGETVLNQQVGATSPLHILSQMSWKAGYELL